ncbi:MAG TPA: indole-3-glycerol phosphate synthase TrpC [Eubacteriaceae bacterium]|nr:indole-3-glycerol phosphate synthase TrpC [Eubacteriaceae bacterium]
MILEQINRQKRKVVEEAKKNRPLEELMQRIEDTGSKEIFSKALQREEKIAIIAEIKKASPSKGLIRDSFDVGQIATAYDRSDIQAISVLTEREFFQGKDENIALAREKTNKPILRKDFIIDEYQVYESKVLGADAVLLIVASLNQKELVRFCQTAGKIGLEVLMEVHNEEETRRACDTEATIIGINNRDLHTFQTDLQTTYRLRDGIAKDRVVVSESGIRGREDLVNLQELGVDGVLIGETFMRSASIEKAVQEMRGL